ncbi:MAG TPA: B12-binding domain-containing protein [Actinomycetota bacterium]|nr:B12-binding domain-containing protein [Actinomycetota bacterium]
MGRTVGNERLTISAVSSSLGIPIPTIRSWERRYGFPAPVRTRGKHRRYSMHEVDLLRQLRDEITRGYPARQAVEVVLSRSAAGGMPRVRYLDDFLASATRLDPTGLRGALDGAAEALGVEAAVRDVALPAMHEMGSRWASGDCDIAHEHLATEAVRVWLARLAAMAPVPFRPKPLVLACGPKDLHSIGLEAFGVLLARRGWDTRVLGSLTPISSLVAAVRAAQAAGSVVTSQRSVTRRAAIDAVQAVGAIPGVTPFFAGDAFAAPAARRDVPGVYLGSDVVEGVAVLERTLR